jgi:lipoprotein-anchoring transpeptidase ErfK/SrfK
MKRMVLGVAAVLVVAVHTGARAEEIKDANATLVTTAPEAKDAAVKASSEGTVAKANADATPEGSAALLTAVAIAQEIATPPLPPPITLTLDVDLKTQRVTVMEGDAVKYVWPISSGRPGYSTQTGTFQPQWTARMWYSRQWDMAPMPYSVFFNRGTAFHATSATGSLGQRASHGCIRLHPTNAAKLYGLVHRHGLYSTKVIVHSSPSDPVVAKRKPNRSYQQASTRQRAARSYSYGGSVWGF